MSATSTLVDSPLCVYDIVEVYTPLIHEPVLEFRPAVDEPCGVSENGLDMDIVPWTEDEIVVVVETGALTLGRGVNTRAAIIDDGSDVTSSLNSRGDDGTRGQIPVVEEFCPALDKPDTGVTGTVNVYDDATPTVDSGPGVTSDVMVKSLSVAKPSYVYVPKLVRSSHVAADDGNASVMAKQ